MHGGNLIHVRRGAYTCTSIRECRGKVLVMCGMFLLVDGTEYIACIGMFEMLLVTLHDYGHVKVQGQGAQKL